MGKFNSLVSVVKIIIQVVLDPLWNESLSILFSHWGFFQVKWYSCGHFVVPGPVMGCYCQIPFCAVGSYTGISLTSIMSFSVIDKNEIHNMHFEKMESVWCVVLRYHSFHSLLNLCFFYLHICHFNLPCLWILQVLLPIACSQLEHAAGSKDILKMKACLFSVCTLIVVIVFCSQYLFCRDALLGF